MTKTVYGSFRPVMRESRKYQRHMKGTFIGLIAYVIQDSPSKMLTFKQIMSKMEVLVTGHRKGLENNIRVCLSSNKCFVKVPIDPEYPNAKRNFWKVDESSITPRMVRRHFSDMAELFPGLSAEWDRKPTPPPAPSPVCPGKMDHRPTKFTGPFSIDSLLKKDHVPQVKINMQQAAQTLPNTNPCFLDEHYNRTATTDSLTCLDGENRQHSWYYRSVEEASWRKPVQRMDSSHEPHHALLYSPPFPYDQAVFTKVSSSPPNTHELRYRKL